MEEKEKKLTARQIGDIYWKKRKKALKSAAGIVRRDPEARGVRAVLKEETLDPVRAERILKRYSKEKEKKQEQELYLTGREFRKRPPTTSGDQAFEDAVLSVLCARDSCRRRLQNAGKEPDTEIKGIWIKSTEALLSLVENTLRLWFAASGIDWETAEPVTAEQKREAREALPEALKLYEEKVSAFGRDLGIRIAKKLGWLGDDETAAGVNEKLEALRRSMDKELERIGKDSFFGPVLEDACTQLSDFVFERSRIAAIRKRWEEESAGMLFTRQRPQDILFFDEVEAPITTSTELRNEAEKLRKLKEDYPEQFEEQTAASVVEKQEVYSHALALALRIRRTVLWACPELEEGEREKLLVLSDTMIRIAYRAIEFARFYGEGARRKQTGRTAAELYAMNYFFQERSAKRAARRFLEAEEEGEEEPRHVYQ